MNSCSPHVCVDFLEYVRLLEEQSRMYATPWLQVIWNRLQLTHNPNEDRLDAQEKINGRILTFVTVTYVTSKNSVFDCHNCFQHNWVVRLFANSFHGIALPVWHLWNYLWSWQICPSTFCVWKKKEAQAEDGIFTFFFSFKNVRGNTVGEGHKCQTCEKEVGHCKKITVKKMIY